MESPIRAGLRVPDVGVVAAVVLHHHPEASVSSSARPRGGLTGSTGQLFLALVLIVPLTPLGKNPPEVTMAGFRYTMLSTEAAERE